MEIKEGEIEKNQFELVNQELDEQPPSLHQAEYHEVSEH